MTGWLGSAHSLVPLPPFSLLREELWNTHAVPSGVYRVTVRADGNVGSRSAVVAVKN